MILAIKLCITNVNYNQQNTIKMYKALLMLRKVFSILTGLSLAPLKIKIFSLTLFPRIKKLTLYFNLSLLHMYKKSKKKNRKRSLISQIDHTVHRIHKALFIQSLLDLILDIILISSAIWFPSPQQMRCSQLEKVWGWCFQRQTLKATKSKLKTNKVSRKTSKHTRLGPFAIDTNNPRGSQSLHKTTLDVHNDPLWYTVKTQVRRS